jgi:hypothetical protein
MGEFIEPRHFRDGIGAGEAQRLFESSVHFVELETFSYCNRKCWFCANSFIDRKTANIYLSEAVFAKILRDLAAIGYAGTVNLSNYNEPLSDRAIVGHIARVRDAAPAATISVYSNGDYVNAGYLAELRDAGLDEIYLSIHTGDREDLNDAKVERRIASLGRKIGAEVEFSKRQPGVQYRARVKYPGMRIQMYEPNMRTLGSNMGELIPGLQEDYRRTSPCLEPFTHFTVNYNGQVVPCCRIRSDAAEHESYVICDLHEVDTIFDAYAHARLVGWRRSLASFGDKASPCGTCDNAVIRETWTARRRFKAIKKTLRVDA